MKEITINNETYRLKEQSKPKPKYNKSQIALLSTIMLYEGSFFPYLSQYYDENPSPDSNWIAKEYELILQKKSNLSARQRENVKWQFNKMYEKVNS